MENWKCDYFRLDKRLTRLERKEDLALLLAMKYVPKACDEIRLSLVDKNISKKLKLPFMVIMILPLV